jgi:hypothetical protein
MATINPVISRLDDNTIKVFWETLTTTNTTGARLGARFADFSDRSVQVTGTFDSAVVTIEGSNDETNYIGLTDPQGNSIAPSAAGGEQIMENYLVMRPRISTAGTGGADLDVTMICRRPRSGMEI